MPPQAEVNDLDLVFIQNELADFQSFQNSADLTETDIHENGDTSLSEKIWDVGRQHIARQLEENQMVFLVVFAGDQL